MTEDELLNFNYPIQSKELIELENKVKEELRTNSLNVFFPKEVERYTDKYVSTVSRQDVLKTINVEIMSPELQKSYGISHFINANIILNEEDDENNANDNIKEESADHNSLEGGDDYEQNYYDEEDLVDENNKNEEVF
jgi:hypothetical protein